MLTMLTTIDFGHVQRGTTREKNGRTHSSMISSALQVKQAPKGGGEQAIAGARKALNAAKAVLEDEGASAAEKTKAEANIAKYKGILRELGVTDF